jgi:hypothetical protein
MPTFENKREIETSAAMLKDYITTKHDHAKSLLRNAT